MIRYTPRAQRKIFEIAEFYSEHALREIQRVIELASHMRTPGVAVADRPGVRRVRAFSWAIYVRHESDGSFVVLRIEHTRRKHGHL